MGGVRPTGSMASSTASPAALPSAQQLLAQERRVRHGGTALTAADLQGCWLLDQVWPRGSQRPATVAATLLRALAARLEITQQEGALALRNAVRFGALELRFCGVARLVGSRPLLVFSFQTLELWLAGRMLLRRALPAPEPRRMPFFALIARGSAGWLAARGRGGGLALWRLGPLADPG